MPLYTISLTPNLEFLWVCFYCLFLLFFSSDIFLCLLTASPLPQCLLLDCFKNFLEKGILLEFPERIYLSLHQVPGEGGIILIQFHLLRCFKVSSGSCECYIPHLTLNLYFIFILITWRCIPSNQKGRVSTGNSHSQAVDCFYFLCQKHLPCSHPSSFKLRGKMWKVVRAGLNFLLPFYTSRCWSCSTSRTC